MVCHIFLEENHASQKTETADRKEANVAYQADVKNLVAAEQLVDNAINVEKAITSSSSCTGKEHSKIYHIITKYIQVLLLGVYPVESYS